jgi:hypothetical protein
VTELTVSRIRRVRVREEELPAIYQEFLEALDLDGFKAPFREAQRLLEGVSGLSNEEKKERLAKAAALLVQAAEASVTPESLRGKLRAAAQNLDPTAVDAVGTGVEVSEEDIAWARENGIAFGPRSERSDESDEPNEYESADTAVDKDSDV